MSQRHTLSLELSRLLWLVLPTLALGACGDRPSGPSVLLITVDTLRADHVGAYQTRGSRTPRLDGFAREATAFENAAAPMPLTRPSHFSIMTSLYPREHGVLNNAIALPDSAITLAELFRRNGYRTAAFVSVSLLGEDSGAGQGFEELSHPSDPRERAAEQTVNEALAWIRELDRDEPFFVWVHLFDPHLPYGPPEPYMRDLDERLAARLPVVNWQQLHAIARRNDGDIPQRVLEYALGLYRGEVEYVDHWTGALLDGLRSSGVDDDLITVFTADHGESFENGVYFEHADSLYDGAIRIPLMIRYPPQFAPGSRVTAQVSAIDIAPTLMAATGMSVPPSFRGRALQDAGSFGDRYVLIQHPFYQPGRAENRPQRQSVIHTVAGQPVSRILVESEQVGIVGTEWKLLRTGDQHELLRRNHDEETAALDDAVVRTRLESVLNRQLLDHPLHLIDTDEINDELLDTLRELGYLR